MIEVKKMNNELISIIIPVYNASNTLPRCLNSVLNQTYKNFEVLLIDDDSKDNSHEVIEPFLLDERFMYHKVEHGGVSRARNTGLSLAKGKYVMFLDADDDLKSTMICKMIDLLEKNKADLAVCRFNHPHFKTYCKNRVYNVKNYRQFMYLFQETFLMTVPWNKVWVRDKITESFDVDVAFAEDELFNVSNLKNCRRVVTTNEVLYNYYCPLKEGNGESAMKKIISQQAFWESKTSPYFKGVDLLPKRSEIISAAIENKKFPVKSEEELKYIRLIDFSFWLLPSFIDSGASKFGLIQEWLNILHEPNFVAGFKAQQKYGFELIDFDDNYLKGKVNQFINCCYEIFEVTKNDAQFKPVYAFITLFMLMFTKQVGILRLVNFQAKFLHDYYWQSTREAIYLKHYLEDKCVTFENDLVINFAKQYA